MILISTESGIYRWDETTQALSVCALEGKDIRHVTSGNGRLVAYDAENSIWESRDSGASWNELAADPIAEEITVAFVHPNGDIYVGTEPPKIYRYSHADDGWELVTDLTTLDGAKDWYTPWGGPPAVRSIAPANADGFYLDIHVGGILRTLDTGKTWQPTNNGLDLDVHEVVTCDKRPNAVYAATAVGFYLSGDRGESWKVFNEGLTNRYTRGIAVHPGHPETILISGSPTSPGGWRTGGKQFALFRTTDDGKQWKKVTNGFPDSSDAEIDTHGIVFSQKATDQVLCGLRSGELYASDDAGLTWLGVADDLPPVSSLCAV